MKTKILSITIFLLSFQQVFAQTSGISLPVFFFRNTGITDSEIGFIVETPELRAAFRSSSVDFRIHGSSTELRFSGARSDARIEGQQELAGRVNIFRGADVRTGIETYGRIRYRDLWPGIDLTYTGAGARVKSEFIVAPGADASMIRLAYDDAARVSIGDNGDLIVTLKDAELRDEAPVVYQNGRTVQGRYRLINEHTAGFEIGDYDHAQTLVIDPTISFSTYLGGSSMGAITGVAVDSSDNVYVTGWTEALNFPIMGAYQASNSGSVNAIAAKLDAAGNALVYATYIGGNGDDQGFAIALDSSGDAYIAGSTTSTNFPLVSSLRSTLGGGRDAFVVKLNPSGSKLDYSTLLGGSSEDWAYAIAVDASGNAYVAGDTQSTDFPTVDAAQSANAGNTDSFITKLSSTCTLVFSTYLGGAGNEHAGGIAIDSSDNVYVAGGTFSSNFPTLGPIQAANAGGENAYVTKLKSTGAAWSYSTYLGGSSGTTANPEQANAIAVDASGNAYIAGVTPSTNFPVTTGAVQTANAGMADAFVAKINAAGSSLVYSTYLGGSSFDQANGIGVDASGDAYVAGYTSSVNFVAVNAVQPLFAGMYDAFVAELNPAGNALTFSTYFGGSGSDEAMALALDSSANIYIAGQTNSTNLPTANAYQNANNGGAIGFVARLGVTAAPAEVPSVVSVSPSSGSGNTVTFTAQYSDPAGATALQNVSILINTSASTNYGCYITYNVSSNTFSLADDVATAGAMTVQPNGGSAENDQCTLNGVGSSVSTSGNTLTMTVVLAFQTTFAGSDTVYLYAQDANANTGWVSKGTWTVSIPPPSPSAVSVSPNANSGASQTFQFVFADSQNPSNITATAMLFAPSLNSFTNTCYMVYDAVHATIQLEYDGMNGATERALAATNVISNSQCSIGAASAQLSGLSLILTVSVTFSGSFSGPQNIYMYAADGSGTPNTGWVNNGTYTVAAGGDPMVNSIVPSTGSGPGQRFSVTVSDPGGSGFIQDIAVLFSSSSTNLTNACLIVYDGIEKTLSLTYDNPANGATVMQFGSNQVASNDQCTLTAATSTVVYGTTQVVLTLSVAFNATFSGTQNAYVEAVEATASSGLTAVGTWTVTGGAPTADSVTPSSGSGSYLVDFTFSATDSVNVNNITEIGMLWTTGAPTNQANACFLMYNRTAGTIGLYDNTGTVLSTKPLGSSAALYNSQCAVGGASMVVSGNSVLFTVQLLFYAAFDTPQTVYEDAIEPSSSSGWVQRGTWTP